MTRPGERERHGEGRPQIPLPKMWRNLMSNG